MFEYVIQFASVMQISAQNKNSVTVTFKPLATTNEIWYE